MTTKLDTQLMPAQNPTKPSPATDPGEEVLEVALFESRKARGTRAWDELAEIDRALLLESVRQRRKLRKQQTTIHNEIYRLRSNR